MLALRLRSASFDCCNEAFAFQVFGNRLYKLMRGEDRVPYLHQKWLLNATAHPRCHRFVSAVLVKDINIRYLHAADVQASHKVKRHA